MSLLSDINIAAAALIWLCVCMICFSIFLIFNLLILYLKWVLCREHIISLCVFLKNLFLPSVFWLVCLWLYIYLMHLLIYFFLFVFCFFLLFFSFSILSFLPSFGWFKLFLVFLLDLCTMILRILPEFF